MANLIRSLWRKGGGKPPKAPETGPAVPDGDVPAQRARTNAEPDDTPHTGSTAQMAAPPKIPALDEDEAPAAEPAEAAAENTTPAQSGRTSSLPNPGAEIVRIRREAAEASQRSADPAAFVRRFVEEREEAETRAEAEAAIDAARERAAFDARRSGSAGTTDGEGVDESTVDDGAIPEANDRPSDEHTDDEGDEALRAAAPAKHEVLEPAEDDDAAHVADDEYREPSEADETGEGADDKGHEQGSDEPEAMHDDIADDSLAIEEDTVAYDDRRLDRDDQATLSDGDPASHIDEHVARDEEASEEAAPPLGPHQTHGPSVAAAAVTAAAAAAAAAMPRRGRADHRIEPALDDPASVPEELAPALQDARHEIPAENTDGIFAAEPERPFVAFTGVQKTYDGQTIVVKDLNLSVRRGEFLTLLGPSGSGKTTTLMMLAGFEQPTAGEILLDGARVTDMPPHKRGIGFVFQNYALFPHMTVAENLAFPLKVRKMARAAIKDRIANALRMVSLEGFEKRRPHQLSGGQQQRVAVARALVFNPALVLMDEPLGALDRHLREQMQFELKRLHREYDLTVVYVTHDQSEALTLSDRIAVFHDGKIQQIDTPQFLYEHPENAFVAGFVGENNMLPGVVESAGEETAMVKLDGGQTIKASRRDCGGTGSRTVVAVRPECVSFAPDPSVEGERNIVTAHVEEHVFHGDHQRFKLAIPNGGSITLKAARHIQVLRGDTVRVVFRVADSRAFRPMDASHAPATPPAPAAPAAKRRR